MRLTAFENAGGTAGFGWIPSSGCTAAILIAYGSGDPTNGTWLSASFPFHDASGQRADLTVRQVIDTRAEPLSYVYDDEPV